MANNITRAVEALVAAQEALAAMPAEDRLQAGEQLASELRKKGALKGFNLKLGEYSQSCRIEAGALIVSIDADADNIGAADGAQTNCSMRNKRYQDMNDDIPF